MNLKIWLQFKIVSIVLVTAQPDYFTWIITPPWRAYLSFKTSFIHVYRIQENSFYELKDDIKS